MDHKKRIPAMLGVIALIALYVFLLISSFGKSESSQTAFRALLASVFILPVLLYGYLLVGNVIRPKKATPIKTILLSRSLENEEALRAYLEELGSRGFPYEITTEVAAFEKGTTVLICDDPELAERTKAAGEIAFLYENLETIKNNLNALNVR